MYGEQMYFALATFPLQATSLGHPQAALVEAKEFQEPLS